MNKQIVKQCVRNADREGYKINDTLSEKELCYYGKGQYEKGGYEYNKQQKENNLLNDNLSEKEISALEQEANQPTIQDQREQLEADIKEVKEILYKLELKLVKLR